jgi:EAL domain-containing protein (putative c-di-GMP-specific phosphodiesterase class I)
VLRGLKDLGVRVALDDFGTGYSSLSYLQRYPISTIKIDRSFVRDIQSDSNDAAIVKAILAMAKELRLDVIAEGVEADQQMDNLKRWGCEFMQGFLVSEALPLVDLPARLKATDSRAAFCS